MVRINISKATSRLIYVKVTASIAYRKKYWISIMEMYSALMEMLEIIPA